MSKEQWGSIEEAVEHYYGEGYEMVEREADGAVRMNKGETPDYAVFVAIWKDRDGNFVSEEY